MHTRKPISVPCTKCKKIIHASYKPGSRGAAKCVCGHEFHFDPRKISDEPLKKDGPRND